MLRTTSFACLALFAVSGCDHGQSVSSARETDRSQIEAATRPSADSTSAGSDPRTSDVPPDIVVDTPDLTRPVTAAAGLHPARAAIGESLTLAVKIQTAPTWHIYAADSTAGTGIPTILKLDLPEGVEAAGEWVWPSARQDGQSRIYEGFIEVRRRLKIGLRAKPGPVQVKCTLSYQACDPFSCRPPEEKTLQAAAVIGSKP
jgi:DsbC/DsbD-like thiol-disulfide interchange protein